jgi:hypothetical protein
MRSGRACARIRALDNAQNFATLTQSMDAEPYRGKALRYTGYLRPEDVRGWTGLWMRVDSADGLSLAFDNMQTTKRSLRVSMSSSVKPSRRQLLA